MIAPITSCRLCGHSHLQHLFSLGDQYVSDFVKADAEPGIKVPISLVLCPNCTLVQLEHTAPQDFMYTRHYWYKSGVTNTMRKSLEDVTRCIENAVDLKPDDVVLDIGSNDGTLLRAYTKDCITVGVEPALNLAEEGAEGVDIFINEFWDANVIDRPVKVVTALGMFYDLPDPCKFVSDIAEVLTDDGVFVAQLMCLKNMLNIGDVGNLAHEHLEFYSLKSLDYMFDKCGLELVDVHTNDVNGESYRLFIRKKSGSFAPFSGSEGRLQRAREAEEGLSDVAYYREFFTAMERNKIAVREFIEHAVLGGKSVWVYGASTKGNVILQYYGLDDKLIEGAADRSPAKHGLFTVGTSIPIHSEEIARERNPDYFLVLPYAFLPEFLTREKEWLEKGGHFLVPLPEFRILGAADVP